MREVYMVCSRCFYSHQTFDEDGLNSEYCFCYADPKPILIAEVIIDGTDLPDILARPSYHRCGRGRWWENGKWIRWIDREDEEGE